MPQMSQPSAGTGSVSVSFSGAFKEILPKQTNLTTFWMEILFGLIKASLSDNTGTFAMIKRFIFFKLALKRICSGTKVTVTHKSITTVEAVDIFMLATAFKSTGRLLLGTFIFMKVTFFIEKNLT